MSLNSKIKTIVDNLSPHCTFRLSSFFKANIFSNEVDSVDLPLVILDNDISKEGQVMLNNNLQLNTRIVMRFLEKDDPLNDDVTRDGIRQSMEDLALRVVANIYQLEEARVLQGRQGFRITPAFNVFSSDMSGVILDIGINENKTINFCES